MALASLLARRLVIVSGKGGTGKTTVAAALGLAAARTGRRVLLAETGADEALAPLVAPGSAPAGYAGRELARGLFVMRIDPFEALAEYLGLQLGGAGLVRRVLATRGFHELLAASPGWRELITLGKLWHLEQSLDPTGRPSFDLIVVDAPATGHGVALLDVPRVVASAVRAGPLRRNALRVEQLLEDAQRTLLLPVALPEELPTRETAELVQKVRGELGLAVDRVVVNGVLAPPFPAGLERLDELLRRLPAEARFGALPAAGTLAACAGFLRSRHALQQGYVELVARLTGLPVLRLPQLAEGIEGPASLERLGAVLLGSATA